jgi:dTDP-4-amino-4,6-dideoxygalactose transaminase
MTSSPTSLLPAASEADLPIPFTDLSIQWRQIKSKALPDIRRLFQSGEFSLGPFVAQFEQAAADYLGIRHAIGVNSGTSALHLALIAAGIGPGDKVLVPSYSALCRGNARPLRHRGGERKYRSCRRRKAA